MLYDKTILETVLDLEIHTRMGTILKENIVLNLLDCDRYNSKAKSFIKSERTITHPEI